VSVGQVDAGAGQRYLPVIFTNRGAVSCALEGYPGVAPLDSSGRQVAQAQREARTPVVRVVLAPGKAASAIVHAGAVPGATNTCPPDYPGLLVTPPGLTQSTKVRVALPACAGLTVTALVAGTAGQ